VDRSTMLSRWVFVLAAALAGCLPGIAETRYSQSLNWAEGFTYEGPALPALSTGMVVAVMGDSITQFGGYIWNVDAAIRRLRSPLLMDKIVIAGRAGFKSSDLVESFPRLVEPHRPSIVVVMIGLNNADDRASERINRTKLVDAFEDDLRRVVDLIRGIGATPVFMTPTIWGEDPMTPTNIRIQFFSDAMKELGVELNVGVMDVRSMFLRAISAKPPDHRGNLLTTDGTHMNDAGNALLSVALMRVLGFTDDEIRSLP